MEIFLDKNNNPNIIKGEEFISKIYSSLLKVNSTLDANTMFKLAIRLLNKTCSKKVEYSTTLVDICILRVLQLNGLNSNLDSAVISYMYPHLNSDIIAVLELNEIDLDRIIYE